MEQFNRIFDFVPQCGVIVCKQCRQCPEPSGIRTHLDQHHAYLSTATRQTIVEAAHQIDGIARTKEDIRSPDRAGELLPHLTVYNDGLACKACPAVFRSQYRIKAHCQDRHGWQNTRKRNRPSAEARAVFEATKPWITGVQCQRFSNGGPMQYWFQVNQRPQQDILQASSQTTSPPSENMQQIMDRAFAGIDAAITILQTQGSTPVDAARNPFVPNAWLKRVGWAKHLAGFDREWVMQLRDTPLQGERRLQRVCEAVAVLFYHAQRTCKSAVPGDPAMFYINRRETGGDSRSSKPLNPNQQGKTIEKYVGVWQAVVQYIWRSQQYEPVTQQEQDVVEYPPRGQPEPEPIKEKRPQYVFTEEQAERWQCVVDIVEEWEDDDDSSQGRRHRREGEEDDSEEESEEDQEQAEALEAAVRRFFIAALDHPLQNSPYDSVVISAMAVIGIDENSGWSSALLYTPKMSAIITLARMLVVHEASIRRSDAMAYRGGSAVAAQSQYQVVQEMTQRFMTLVDFNGQPTPMDWILQSRSYGMKIRYTTNAEGVIDWQGDRLLFGHVQFSISQLRGWIHGMVQATRVQLRRGLLLLDVDNDGKVREGTTQLPQIRWGELFDDARESEVGWSFLKDPRSKWDVDGTQWLAKRVSSEQALREAFVDREASMAAVRAGQGANGVVWQKERVEAYAEAIQVYRERLLVLMHVTGGQPARGTELVTVQVENGVNSEGRGIYIEDGLAAYVTAYHKNIESTGKAKYIHRYLPQEVGELLVYYLWLVQPFWKKLVMACGSQQDQQRDCSKNSSTFVWQPKADSPYEPAAIRRRQRSSKRQRRDRGVEDVAEVNRGQHAADDTIEGAVEQERFPREVWDTDQVRKALQRASSEWMGVKVNIMCWRHAAKAIYRRYIDDARAVRTVFDTDEDTGDVEGEGGDEAADLQAGHTSAIAAGQYGRDTSENPFHTMERRLAFRRVSIEWHRFLMFESALPKIKGEHQDPQFVVGQAARDTRFRRWEALRKVDIHAALRRLVGEKAAFRGIQEQAIRAVVAGKSRIVAVMGTGGGKSLIFMLPAACTDGVTVVVVPLVSLRADLARRCKQAGIECVEWDSNRPHEGASIVLVTPEAAVRSPFGSFLNRQRIRGRLERIVIDECHTVLDAREDGWRVAMSRLRSLAMAEAQMVFLTATLPPKHEANFMEVVGINREQSEWFRGSTSKGNITYAVLQYSKHDDENSVVETIVGELLRRYTQGQIVVYHCGSIEQTEALAEVLDAVCYHRQVGSAQEKQRRLTALIEGEKRVFVATNALGLGVDAPTIRAVIHVGKVRRLRDYIQESGRAGRDGQQSDAIVLQAVGEEGWWDSEGVEAEMVEYIDTKACRRVVVDREMDGRVDRAGCEVGEERCDRCEGRSEGVGGDLVSNPDCDPIHDTIHDTIDEPIRNPIRNPVREPIQAQQQQIEEQQQKAVQAQGQGQGQGEVEGREQVEFDWQERLQAGLSQQEGQEQQGQEQKLERFVEKVEKWAKGCCLCRALQKEEKSILEHKRENCREELAAGYQVGVEQARGLIRRIEWAQYSCCFECGMPQQVCRLWERNERNGRWRRRRGGQCQFKEVLIEAVMAIWTAQVNEFTEWIERQTGKAGFEEGIRWMRGKGQWGEVERNIMCEVLLQWG